MVDSPADEMMVDYYNAISAPVDFVVYDPNTGVIIQSGICPPSDYPLQQLLHSHNVVMRGRAPSIEGYIVREGEIVKVDDEGE